MKGNTIYYNIHHPTTVTDPKSDHPTQGRPGIPPLESICWSRVRKSSLLWAQKLWWCNPELPVDTPSLTLPLLHGESLSAVWIHEDNTPMEMQLRDRDRIWTLLCMTGSVMPEACQQYPFWLYKPKNPPFFLSSFELWSSAVKRTLTNTETN